MKFFFAYFSIAAAAFAQTAPNSPQPHVLGLSKRELVRRFGFPAEIRLFEPGGPFTEATEDWVYYVRRSSTEIAMWEFWFRSGHSYSGPYIRRGEKVVDMDKPGALEEVLAYKKKLGSGGLRAR